MSQHNYYKVWFSEEEPEGLIAYEQDLKGMNEYTLSKGVRINDWPSNVTLHVEGKHPEDRLFSAVNDWIIVSKRVQQVFEAYDIQGVQFLPVRIVHKSGVEIPGYAVLNVLNVIPALDREHTVWVTPEKDKAEYPQLNILKVALSKSAIGDANIFRLQVEEPTTRVFISRRLKACLEQASATSGFRFIPVAAY